LKYEQSYHEAERQRATREMQEALTEGEKTATFLRMGIKLVYGNDNDKLLEFGIQPLRRRSGQKRKKAATPQALPEEMPELEAPALEEDVLLEASHPAEVVGSGPIAQEGDEPDLPAVPAAATGEGDGTRAGGIHFGSPEPSAKGPSPLGGGGLENRGAQEEGGLSEENLGGSRPLTAPASG
jgi:hypothetical protein